MRYLFPVACLVFLPIKIIFADVLDDASAAYQEGDYQKVFKIDLPLANKGDPVAQTHLGFLYQNGKGTAKDFKEALKWYRLAATQGNISAAYNLGVMYSKGEGTTQDINEALKWYRLAATHGDVDAAYNLGVIYSKDGQDIQNLKEAMKWYRLAASKNHSDARHNLNVLSKKALIKNETVSTPSKIYSENSEIVYKCSDNDGLKVIYSKTQCPGNTINQLEFDKQKKQLNQTIENNLDRIKDALERLRHLAH